MQDIRQRAAAMSLDSPEDFSADDPITAYEADDPSEFHARNAKLESAARRRKNELASKSVFRKKRADEQEATFCSMLPFFCLIAFVVVMVVGIVYEEWHVVKRFYRKMEEWEESIL